MSSAVEGGAVGVPMDSEQRTADPLFVVGLGASAGGIETLRPLIAALRPNGRVAYIVVQHMAPQYASVLPELLSKDAKLQVRTAQHGDVLAADCVYVTPPNHDAAVRDGQLVLTPPSNTVGPKPSIDVLFTSMAEVYREHAVGVVLSGTGSDGTLGCRAIKTDGGLVLAQLRSTAKHDGMPMAVLRSGVVDHELGVSELASHLNTLPTVPRVSLVSAAPESGEDAVPPGFTQLIDLIRRVTNIDFSRYKMGTLRRQVERRMAALRIPELSGYVDLVTRDADEVLNLQRSFLISVTSFFRDAESYASLREVVGKVIGRKPQRSSLRVWVPGCATGEEAYSIAILIEQELGPRSADLDVRVFATDIDTDATDFARAGTYSAASLETAPAAVRDHFFVAENGAYRVSKSLRDRCVFARQDVVRDAPFLRMDIVSCRNVLIYFRADLQDELLGKFHYALNPGGVLFLGKSESIPLGSSLFSSLDAKARIFQRRSVPSPRSLGAPPIQPAIIAPRATPPRGAGAQRISAVQEALARSYAPPAVLLGGAQEPLHFFGECQRYFAFSEGSADFSLPAMLLPDLRAEARTLLFRAAQSDEELVVGYPIRINVGGVAQSVRLRVRKVLTDDQLGERLLLVAFEDVPELRAPADLPEGEPDANVASRIVQLQTELFGTREHLQAVIEELETSNEELQSLNEELQASSEELQASNEELQTTNEELQATNEELTTVNDELSIKNQESQHLSEALTNVQNSVQAGILVVDRQGRILRFNRLAVRFFGVMPEDVGTSLHGLPSYLPLPHLRRQVELAVQGQSSLERCERDGMHFVVQLSPYITEAGASAGAVISLLDVTELRKTEMELARSERRFRHLADALDEVVWMRESGNRRTLYVSPSYARLSGRSVETLYQTERAYLEAVHPDDHARLEAALAPGKDVWSIAYRIVQPDGSVRHVMERGRTVAEEHGEIAWCVSSIVDVTERVLKEEALSARLDIEARLNHIAAAVPGAIFALALSAELVPSAVYFTPRAAALIGVSEAQLQNEPDAVVARVHAEDRARVRAAIAETVAQLRPCNVCFRLQDQAGDAQWLEIRAFAQLGEGGGVAAHGFVHDVTERMRAEQALEQSEARHRALFEQAVAGIAELSLDGHITRVNAQLASMLQCTPGSLQGVPLADFLHPQDRAEVLSEGQALARGEGEAGSVVVRELRLGSESAGYRWAAMALGVLRESTGAARALTFVASDVHARKVAEDEARHLNEQLGNVLQTAHDAVVSIDPSLTIVVFNPAAERLFGLSAAEAIGLPIERLVPEDQEAAHGFFTHDFSADGLHASPTLRGAVEIMGRHRDGAELPIEASFSTVTSRGVRLCTAILRDIRERRLAEQRLRALTAELTRLNRVLDERAIAVTGELARRTESLERSNAELQQFAYVASHDLQTPLNAIAGFLELLHMNYQSGLDARGQEWISRAVDGAHQLKRLIRGLLDFASMDHKAQRFVDVDLGELCDEVCTDLQHVPNAKEAQITRDTLPVVSGDRMQLAQLFHNLIGNGIKYGGPSPCSIHLSATESEGMHRILVRDDGIGIQPAHHERIFEMFQRLHDERTYPGTGIGLALCRRIVHRHEGRIGVESEQGKGSTFWFTLPVRQATQKVQPLAPRQPGGVVV